MGGAVGKLKRKEAGGMGFRAGNRDNGASLVEFAVIMPLLLILVLGIIEFGFVLAQMNEIRHGAREGARYAAVSRPDYDGGGGSGDNADVLAVVCDSVNLPGATVTVELSGGLSRYDYGTVRVVADTDSLSNAPIISSLLPDSLTNEATFRLEQDANWSGFGETAC
jgi:Flp pilus assembly protein TadG